MTEIINLNQQRKANAKTQKEKTAAQNRSKFGRTKGQKQREEQEKGRLERHLEGHKREKDEDNEDN